MKLRRNLKNRKKRRLWYITVKIIFFKVSEIFIILNQEIEDLKSQLRDVLFYLDAQKQISETDGITNEEIQDSHLHIQQNNDENASASKGRLRRKKK